MCLSLSLSCYAFPFKCGCWDPNLEPQACSVSMLIPEPSLQSPEALYYTPEGTSFSSGRIILDSFLEVHYVG